MTIKWGSQPFKTVGSTKKGDDWVYEGTEIGGKLWVVLKPANGVKSSSGKAMYEGEDFTLELITGKFKDGYLLATAKPSLEGQAFEFQNSKTAKERWIKDGCLIAVDIDGHKALERLHKNLTDKPDAVLIEFIKIPTISVDLPPDLEDTYKENIELQLEDKELQEFDEKSQQLEKLGYKPYFLIEESDLQAVKNGLKRQGVQFVHINDVVNSFVAPDEKKQKYSGGKGGGYYSPEQRQAYLFAEAKKYGCEATTLLEFTKYHLQSNEHWLTLQILLNVSGSYTPSLTPVTHSLVNGHIRLHKTIEGDVEADGVPYTVPVDVNSSVDSDVENNDEETETEQPVTPVNQTFDDSINYVDEFNTWLTNYKTPGQIPADFKYPHSLDLGDDFTPEGVKKWCQLFYQLVIEPETDISNIEFKKLIKSTGVKKRSVVLLSISELEQVLELKFQF